MRRLTAGRGLGLLAFLAACLLFTAAAAGQPTLPFNFIPASGAFPGTEVGATSAVTFTFTWTASLQGSLGQFSAPLPFVIQTNDCAGKTLNDMDTCKVILDFAPTVAGQASGNLTFAYTAGTQPGTDSIPLSGTGTSAVKVGTPYIAGASLKGMREREPDLKFKLHDGLNAPKISLFTLGLPHGLSFNASKLKDDVTIRPGHWHCGATGKEMATCKTKTPVTMATATFNHPALMESKRLHNRWFLRGNVKKLDFEFLVEDATGTQTHFGQEIPGR